MNFTCPTDFEQLTPSQQVMQLLELSKEYPDGNHKKDAERLIELYSAKELFEPDDSGKNVLHYAISAHNTAVATALINKDGATSEQLFHQDIHGYTPLHDAIDNSREMLSLELIKKATTREQLQWQTHADDDSKTPLQMANDKLMHKVAKAINKRIKDLSPESTQNKIPIRFVNHRQQLSTYGRNFYER